MERIVQLKESEYIQLCENASLREKDIERRAKELWKNNGAPIVEIRTTLPRGVDFVTHVDTVILDDEQFKIDDSLRKRFEEVISYRVKKRIEDSLGDVKNAIKHFRKKEKEVDRIKYILFTIACSGWCAFSALLFRVITA